MLCTYVSYENGCGTPALMHLTGTLGSSDKEFELIKHCGYICTVCILGQLLAQANFIDFSGACV